MGGHPRAIRPLQHLVGAERHRPRSATLCCHSRPAMRPGRRRTSVLRTGLISFRFDTFGPHSVVEYSMYRSREWSDKTISHTARKRHVLGDCTNLSSMYRSREWTAPTARKKHILGDCTDPRCFEIEESSCYKLTRSVGRTPSDVI